MNPIAGKLLAAVDWSAYLEHDGPAAEVGAALHDLLTSSDVDGATSAWKRIEEHVFWQGTIYPVAEPTVSVMLAALMEQQPSWRSGWIVDLLFFIVCGVSLTARLCKRGAETARERGCGCWRAGRLRMRGGHGTTPSRSLRLSRRSAPG